MTSHINTTVASIALQVAELENTHDVAVERHEQQVKELANLNRRVNAARAQIQALRATASERELTDREAATLNLAIMDAIDLDRMTAKAGADARVAALAIDPVRASLNASRRELAQWTGKLRCETLREAVLTREAELCDALMELWTAKLQATPDARFIDAWKPGEGLRRAAVHHQPPSVGSFSG